MLFFLKIGFSMGISLPFIRAGNAVGTAALQSLYAPVARGDRLGIARLIVNGEVLAQTDLLSGEDVARLDLMAALRRAASLWPASALFRDRRKY